MLVESGHVTENGEITVMIADDHEVVREGLRLALLRSPHIRVVGEAPDGETAVALAERRRPDVVIMDLRMPQMDGIEAARRIREQRDTPIIFITAHGDATTRAHIEKVLPGTPVLAKPITAERLKEAIASVMKG